MATRLYFANETAPISPTADASWESATPVRRGNLVTFKSEVTTVAFAENIAAATTLNSPAGAVDRINVQMISPKLNGNQTISGAIKGQILGFESNAAANARMQCVIRVLSGDGTTVRGTLIASNGAALSSEFNTTIQNRKIPLGGSTVPTSVNALDGDRIVVELGWRKHESATTSRTVTLQIGNPSSSSTDLPEDETDTTQTKAPWIEFADTLAFQDAAARIASETVRVALVDSAGSAARLASESARIVVAPSAAGEARLAALSVRVVVPSATPARRTQVIWVG